MRAKVLVLCVLHLLVGCTSRVSKETLTNFSFPVQPSSNEIVIYIAKKPAYVSPSEYFSIEINGQFKILNSGDCNYFVLKNKEFTMRSKRNAANYPIASLRREDLQFGRTYYFELNNNGRSIISHFKEVTANDIKPICAEFGFGRFMNNPPYEGWGKNDLQ